MHQNSVHLNCGLVMVDVICIYAFVRVIWKLTETGDTRSPVLPNVGTISKLQCENSTKENQESGPN
jgi:hypothetical protein